MPFFSFVTLKLISKPVLNARQFHVGQELRLVDPFDFFDSLQFDDQFILNQYVDSISAIESDPFVCDRLRMLQLE